MIDLNALVVFLAVVESGGFSQAGRRLHISQSSVSQTVQSLEKQVGTSLFTRSGRSVSLTEAGQTLAPMARELIANARRIEATMASMQNEVAGHISIGCSTTSGKYLLPGLIARFRRSHPNVNMKVVVASRATVISRLLEGHLPLGVTSKRLDTSDLEYTDFFTDEVILIVPKQHPWARFGSIYPDDLLDEPLILREEGAGTLELLFDGLRQHDIAPDMLKVAMTLGNAEAIEMAVEEELGVAFISRLAGARGLALGRVVEVKVERMSLSREIYLARCPKYAPARSQSEFWNFVRNSRAEIAKFVKLS